MKKFYNHEKLCPVSELCDSLVISWLVQINYYKAAHHQLTSFHQILLFISTKNDPIYLKQQKQKNIISATPRLTMSILAFLRWCLQEDRNSRVYNYKEVYLVLITCSEFNCWIRGRKKKLILRWHLNKRTCYKQFINTHGILSKQKQIKILNLLKS